MNSQLERESFVRESSQIMLELEAIHKKVKILEMQLQEGIDPQVRMDVFYSPDDETLREMPPKKKHKKKH